MSASLSTQEMMMNQRRKEERKEESEKERVVVYSTAIYYDYNIYFMLASTKNKCVNAVSSKHSFRSIMTVHFMQIYREN